jgi:hypothetical protein
MNREKAGLILQAYGKPQVKVKEAVILFSRQNEEDITEIEQMSDADLISQWKSLVFVNEILGQVSLNELQRINLIELEFIDRENIKQEDLKNWFDTAMENFNEDEFWQQYQC